MINLLPPTEKQKLLLEQRKKLAVILWIFVFFSFFCTNAVLFSIKFYIQGQLESQKIIFQQEEEKFKQSETQKLQEELDSTNLNLTKLNTFYSNKIYLIQILEKISNALPQDLYLTNFSAVFFRTGEDEKKEEEKELGYEISLSGFSPNRDLLFEFKTNLEQEDVFQKVYFPPANWVEIADINFFTTLRIIQEY